MPPPVSFLERNLESLRAWTPAMADAVAHAEVPSGWTRANGPDGTLTFQRILTGPPRRVEWLGGTSMPAASAEAIVSSLDPGTVNGLGLSIGTGYEWRAFAAKLGRAQALFIYEPDPVPIRMALEICDLSDVLRSGKIVVFTGNTAKAAAAVSAFLTDHLGYDAPSVLHPLSTLSAERRNELVTAGEAIVRVAVAERQMLVSRLTNAMEREMGTLTDATVAFTVRPRYAGERPLQESLGNIAAEIPVDSHDTASLALRLKTLIERRPRKVVSDLFRGQLNCVPPAVVVETWVPPLVGPGFWSRVPPAGTFTTNDRVVVHAASQQSRLVGQGIPVTQIEVRPVRPTRPSMAAAKSLAIRHRVAVIGDLLPLDPASLSIQLPTHLTVFAAAKALVTEEYLSVHVNAANDILRRALIRSGVVVGTDGATDPALREPMLQVVRDVLIPTLPLLTLAEMLMTEGIPLRLVGDWTGLPVVEKRDVVVQSFSSWQGRGAGSEIEWGDVAVLLHLSPTGAVSPLVWEAVQAGVAAVGVGGMGGQHHPSDALAGTLASLLKPNVEYVQTSAAQLLNTVKSLLRDEERRRMVVAAAQARAAALT